MSKEIPLLSRQFADIYSNLSTKTAYNRSGSLFAPPTQIPINSNRYFIRPHLRNITSTSGHSFQSLSNPCPVSAYPPPARALTFEEKLIA